MNVTLRTEKLLVCVVLGLLLHPVFQGVAILASARSLPPPWWLVTPLDRALPFVPAAVWVYLSWYPASLALLVADRPTFRRAWVAYVLAFGICIASHLVFPVTIARPSLLGSDGLSARVLIAVYAADRPINLLPSFHTAVAAILFRLRPTAPLLAAGVAAWVLGLCAACLLTKQHYVLDVVTGLLLGSAAVSAVSLRAWTVAPASKLPTPE